MGMIKYLFLCTTLVVAEETIKYAAVIYRHGDRTPVNTYPTDPYKNESLWPVKFGQLTNIGKSQHYAFGQWLRKRYSHLLSDGFDPTEICVRSTDVDRTLMSAQANLAGMYPAKGKSIWNKNLMWQPIPIHTLPEVDDEVLAMKKDCPAYNKELQRYKHTKKYIDELSRYQPLMDYMSAYTGKKIKDYDDILDVYSVLRIDALYNFTLPAWTSKVYPQAMWKPAGHSFTTSAATPLLARLRAGPLLRTIMDDMLQSLSAPEHHKRRVNIYSGHDFTIGTILTALNLYDGHCPEYTSAIFFELLHDDPTTSSRIRISYRNFTGTGEPYVLTIPYCADTCSINRFLKLYENLVTVNFDAECDLKITQQSTFNIFHFSYFLALILLAIVILMKKRMDVPRK